MATDLRYPKYDLEQSVDVARKISDRGVGATLSSHELAAALDYSGTNNGAYLNRVAAARLFGLIDGQAEAIGVTKRAERILHPDYPEAAAAARIEAFKAVTLYLAFLDAFRGRTLERPGMLSALVTRFRIPEDEAGKVLGRLLLSAEQAGLFKAAGNSRMIEPTLNRPDGAQPANAEEVPYIEPGRVAALEAPGRKFPKIIEGALDLMPSSAPWDEVEYLEWLAFFDQACRVYFRIARGGKSAPSN